MLLFLTIVIALNYHDTNICRSFSLLEAIAISFPLNFSITFKIEKEATTIAIVIVGRAITIRRAIQKRSHESIKKNDTKNEAKRLRTTTFAIAKSQERLPNQEQYRKVDYCYRNM